MAKVPRLTYNKTQSSADVKNTLLARLVVSLTPTGEVIESRVANELSGEMANLAMTGNVALKGSSLSLQKLIMEFVPEVTKTVKQETSTPIAPVAEMSHQVPQVLYLPQQQAMGYVAHATPITYATIPQGVNVASLQQEVQPARQQVLPVRQQFVSGPQQRFVSTQQQSVFPTPQQHFVSTPQQQFVAAGSAVDQKTLGTTRFIQIAPSTGVAPTMPVQLIPANAFTNVVGATQVSPQVTTTNERIVPTITRTKFEQFTNPIRECSLNFVLEGKAVTDLLRNMIFAEGTTMTDTKATQTTQKAAATATPAPAPEVRPEIRTAQQELLRRLTELNLESETEESEISATSSELF